MTSEHNPGGGETGSPPATRAPGEDPAAQTAPGADATTKRGRGRRRDRHREDPSANMLPGRQRRRSRIESFLMRLVATAGIVGIGVAIAAIMISNKSEGWLVGLVVSIVSVVLAATLWSSRML